MASRAKSRTLTDHEEIRRWAEERDARPSAVRRTHRGDNTSIIRLDFPGYSGENSLEEISWDEWFEDFDNRNLALIVQDETANGEQSNFNKLVSRQSVAETSGKKRNQSTRGGSSRTSKSRSRGRSRTATASSKSRTSTTGAKKRTAERSHRSSRRKAA